MYTITKERIITNLQKNTTADVTVINKYGDSLMPCFQNAIVKNNTLVVTVKKFDPDKPTAFQCGETNETISLLNSL